MLDLPTHPGLRHDILYEAHFSRFMVHPDFVKMYHDMCRPTFLVARAEEICPRHDVTMSCLLVGQYRALEARRIVADVAAARVEVRLHHM